MRYDIVMTDTTTTVKQLIKMVESKGFSQLKAHYKGSPYGDPKSFFSHTPKITCFDPNSKFIIMDVCSPQDIENDTIKDRWAAFAKHAELHKSHFWLFCPKGSEMKVNRYLKEADITSKVHALKFITIA